MRNPANTFYAFYSKAAMALKPYPLLLALLFGVSTGCATHYHRRQPDGLHFFLRLPEARKVELACTCKPFKIYRAEKAGSRLWSVTIPATGEFSYFYIVDGKSYLPDCSLRERDDFGSQNCVYQPDGQGGYRSP